MDLYEIHPNLTRAFVQPTWCDQDVLAWMTMLYLYDLTFRPGMKINEEILSEPRVFQGLTLRSAASCVASVWSPPDPRSGYVHWYWLWNKTTPYSDISAAPPEFAAKIFEFVEKLKKHPLVADVQHVT